jgi:hypothetical protein
LPNIYLSQFVMLKSNKPIFVSSAQATLANAAPQHGQTEI